MTQEPLNHERGFSKAPLSSAADNGICRQTAEFLVVLCLSILLFRTFAAEAYIVPTGSMAPTLLGNHREVICPNCDFHVSMGLDEKWCGGSPICPNCGQIGLESAPAVTSCGDRVLVQKFLYDLRRPRRWEVAVFHFPGDPSVAYVKRVVGLPGESLMIHRGDILANGVIARKTLKEQRGMRILVYDNNFVPRDVNRFPRFRFQRGMPLTAFPTGWRTEGTAFVHDQTTPATERIDWVEYRHWDPDRARYSPIYDFNGYNGTAVPGENIVTDLMVSTRVTPGLDSEAVALRIDSGADRFIVEIPIGGGKTPTLLRNRRLVPISNIQGGLRPQAKGALIEASVMDRRLTVALDGIPLFDPIDFDDPAVGPSSGDSPIAIGTRGGVLKVEDFKISRDIYYTSARAFPPGHAFGVDSPYLLGKDDFFVLGDNSAVSHDSRFWAGSPVVPGELFLGKPFLVHLPGQAVPLEVFGRSLYWVPDPREIRYIR